MKTDHLYDKNSINNIKLIRIPYYQKEITLQHLIQ